MGRRMRCAGCGRACASEEFSPEMLRHADAATRACKDCEASSAGNQPQEHSVPASAPAPVTTPPPLQESAVSQHQPLREASPQQASQDYYQEEEEVPQQQEPVDEAPPQVPYEEEGIHQASEQQPQHEAEEVNQKVEDEGAQNPAVDADHGAAPEAEPLAEVSGGHFLLAGYFEAPPADGDDFVKYFHLPEAGRISYRPNPNEQYYGTFEIDAPTEEEQEKQLLAAIFVHWDFHVDVPNSKQSKIDQEGGTLFAKVDDNGNVGLVAGAQLFYYMGPNPAE